MMAITLLNVSEGVEVSDYRVQVFVTDRIGLMKMIGEGKVTRHKRADGWRALIRRAAEQCEKWEDV